LSKVRTFADGDPEIAELKAALARSGNSGARGGMFYALGKMLDDAGRHEEAFAAFAEGAALIGGESPYASASVKQLLHETVANFTPAFLAELDRSTIDSRKPIFVMGMPRSGTTLAEQILASHPGVIGGGEHFLLNCAAMGVPHFTPNAMRAYAARNAGGNAWTKVGATYLRLLDDQFGQSQHIVDKSLAPFSVGAIAHTFPNARIIWMKRDPAAVAWSCFKTRFTDGLGWSWSFERIADYFKIHDALHAHWTKLFPDKILTVSYADLVGAPDAWIRRLQAHAGLTEGDQTRSFQRVERTVRTASAVQVRKPIYTSADEAWRPYSRHMSGFFETYGAAP
jgi:hypothetical protein